MEGAERGFKRFMYDSLYHHPAQLEVAARAREVAASLYAAYSQEPVMMDEEWIDRLPRFEPERSRHVADYIAGMTDRFAISRYTEIYDRTPEGLSSV
jgi:dGTPase